ncbi:unnamed protein product [Dovyalis caffra]|uniref:Uncharacterized protein n=1 Tax=Dovyalis caffra TaxID=77055 RepID=A0AAV1RBN9_9ROSI|nr:unnamed protein product [Dovyalis caffra]
MAIGEGERPMLILKILKSSRYIIIFSRHLEIASLREWLNFPAPYSGVKVKGLTVGRILSSRGHRGASPNISRTHIRPMYLRN